MLKAQLNFNFVSGIIGSATMAIEGSTSEILEHARLMYEGNSMLKSIEIVVDNVIIHTIHYDSTSGILK